MRRLFCLFALLAAIRCGASTRTAPRQPTGDVVRPKKEDAHGAGAAFVESAQLGSEDENFVQPPEGLLRASLINDPSRLRSQFAQAEPFPHIAIEDFMQLEFAEKLLKDFPPFESGINLNEFGKPGLKSHQPDLRSISPAYAELSRYVCSFEFLHTVSEVTGIDDLLCDPSFFGAGTHENKHGQSLATHIDFNYSRDRRWHRRLNILFYLNKDWKSEWGGRIELSKDPWVDASADAAHRIYDINFNRAVIFATSEHSWHGFKSVNLPSEELAKGRSRKLISLYLYTRERPASETAALHSTQYTPVRPVVSNTTWACSRHSRHANRRQCREHCAVHPSDCELARHHTFAELWLKHYFRDEVLQNRQIQHLEASVTQASLGKRVHGDVALLPQTQGCGHSLEENSWFETLAWFEVRPNRATEVRQVHIKVNFGNFALGNRLADSTIKFSVYSECKHSVRLAGSVSATALPSGRKTVFISLAKPQDHTCVLTVFTRAVNGTGNRVGGDSRELMFLLESAVFKSSKGGVGGLL